MVCEGCCKASGMQPAAELPPDSAAPHRVVNQLWFGQTAVLHSRFLPISPAAELSCSCICLPAAHTCSLVQSGRPATVGRDRWAAHATHLAKPAAEIARLS